jgi:hypothetical protein
MDWTGVRTCKTAHKPSFEKGSIGRTHLPYLLIDNRHRPTVDHELTRLRRPTVQRSVRKREKPVAVIQYYHNLGLHLHPGLWSLILSVYFYFN